MKTLSPLFFVFAISFLLVVMGCGKPYKVLMELQQPFIKQSETNIGIIEDNLPIDMEEKDKPSLESIKAFKQQLAEQLRNKGVFTISANKTKYTEYIVTGQLIEYKKGSGFLRFLFGRLGAARMKIYLDLVDAENNELLFSGEFSAEITDWSVNGNKIFEKVAENFVDALEDELERLDREEKFN